MKLMQYCFLLMRGKARQRGSCSATWLGAQQTFREDTRGPNAVQLGMMHAYYISLQCHCIETVPT